MALTAEQQVEHDKVTEALAEVTASVTEMQQVVYNSLSIVNVGGSHIFNLGQKLQTKLVALEAQLEALKNA